MFARSARYYDAIYAAAGKNYQAEAACLRDRIERHQRSDGARLLDVACGTGGHLAFLQEHFEAEGLDRCPAMLEVARTKLPRVPLHQGDMVDFNLGRAFDVVVCLFSSIGYAGTVEKMKETVSNLAAHTRAGGVVAVEPWIYPADFKDGTVHALFVDDPEAKIARMNVSKVKHGVAVLDLHHLIVTTAGVEHFVERHELTLFRHEEYVSAFEAAGLEVVHDREGLNGRGLFLGLKPGP